MEPSEEQRSVNKPVPPYHNSVTSRDAPHVEPEITPSEPPPESAASRPTVERSRSPPRSIENSETTAVNGDIEMERPKVVYDDLAGETAKMESGGTTLPERPTGLVLNTSTSNERRPAPMRVLSGDLRFAHVDGQEQHADGTPITPALHLGDTRLTPTITPVRDPTEGATTPPPRPMVRFWSSSFSAQHGSREGESHSNAASPTPGQGVRFSVDRRRGSRERRQSREQRREENADVYYDSRASTRREFRRRASTLSEYYARNPTVLPQLPYTLRHGWRRWKVIGMGIVMVIDACIIPIVLYYVLTFGANIAEWIIFAIVATMWGGPTYWEFATRSWKLIKKENFYRPLGQTSRWGFDSTEYVFIVIITAVTAFLSAGSAPHYPWIRVLSLPAPSILLTFGGCMFVQTMWSISGAKAPFRVSSTPKGGRVPPGVYTLLEDMVAVSGNAGRPYREALEARYLASPRFRELMRDLSLFWSIPALLLGTALFIVICHHHVTKEVAYGVGWATPFVWAGVWLVISIQWVHRALQREHDEWEGKKMRAATGLAVAAAMGAAATVPVVGEKTAPDLESGYRREG